MAPRYCRLPRRVFIRWSAADCFTGSGRLGTSCPAWTSCPGPPLGLDLLPGLLGGPLVGFFQPLLAQGIDLLSGQIRQEVQSDRKSSPTGERPSRRCWAPPPGPPFLASQAASRRHTSRQHTSGMAQRFGAPEALRLPGADRKRELGTRIENENRELEPEPPLRKVPCQPLGVDPLSLQPRANRWTKAKLSNVSFTPTA